jgi:uncharacterized membrane protein YGL010W
MTREHALLAVVGLLIVVFSVLLVRHWHHRGRRMALIGDILLLSIAPVFVITPRDNLLLIFAVGGGLLVAGLACRIVAERIGEDVDP